MRNICIETFNKNIHMRENFDCGKEILNIYLKERANRERNKKLNVIYVAVPDELENEKKPILGYFTLSASCIAHPHLKEDSFYKHVPSTYKIPSIKIGRLAVDVKYQNSGIGKLLLKDALIKIAQTSSLVGVMAVEVFAKDAEASNFYQKCGFKKLNNSENVMIMAAKTIKDQIFCV